ncbi:MAG: DNA translocase FtsK 4TM domain-containing protein, partial [Candidatus Pacebacteria bacterium]|nr:DNA translocase FtsK 4TM domain-containing protein [Candidatus Paceibacterota bacterium]
ILIALIALGGMAGGAGIGGFVVARAAYALFGAGALIIPLSFGTAGIFLVRNKQFEITAREIITASIGLLSLLTLVAIVNPVHGGLIGRLIALPLVAGFEKTFASIILVFVVTCSFALFFDRTPHLFPFFAQLWDRIRAIFHRGPASTDSEEDTYDMSEPILPDQEPSERGTIPVAPAVMKVTDASANDLVIDTKRPKAHTGAYMPPPLSLLEGDRGKANVGDVKANANVIRRTLGNFGIEVEMDEITIGPTVTRYALKPAQGVKLSRIVGLQNDLALSLAAHPLRIEAPIPGKSLVGIEIPNKTKATVGLANLLSDPAFQQSRPLTIALGRNIAGKSVLRSIAKMPHLLIAGTTGSGKSVTIHSIITSLLYKHGPDDLRFIFVDPKRVELTLYNGIPHLLTPVITEPKKAILALKWAATEMNRRYDILEGESARDIDSYHKKYASTFAKPAGEDADGTPDRMPYIVIIIDELADIMQAFPRELEAAIVRLAQMSRAVGIHLILSTQRPEVNIITGLIKANIPSRLALRVPTGIDSRTILDTTGAEKLLGNGDTLALVESNQPERVQSAYISEDEVKSVVKYLKNAFADDIRDTIELSGNITGEKNMFSDSMENEDDDALYEEARQCIMEAGKASTSYLQRKLKVGYARAARLMDMLEERGVIGASDGAKPREVLEGGLKHAASDALADEMGI